MSETYAPLAVVADADQAGRAAVAGMIRRAGFRVAEAETSGEALTLAADRPDLVILAVHFPDQTGFETCRRLKAAAAAIPVLYLASGPLSRAEKLEGFEAGGLGYLSAADPEELLAQVCAVLRGRSADAATHENEQRLRLALDAGKMGSWQFDLHGDVLTCSDACKANFGRRPDSPFTYADLFEAIHPDDRVRVRRAVRRALRDHADYEAEYRVVWPDGALHWVLARGAVVCDAERRPVRLLGVTLDISARKTSEEGLREADRNKDAFLAQLAHELRNPLSSLFNGLHLIRLQGGDAGLRERALDLAARQVEQLTRLIDGLLDLARVRQGKMALKKSAVDLNAVVARAVETVRAAVEGRCHDLEVAVPLGPVLLHADSSRLEQVLVNLLHNAAKYTEVGGRIRLTVEKGDGEAVVRVRDTGVGLAPEMIGRIFHLYAQDEGARGLSQGGLGIGLSLVRSLVEMHGGRVQAFSDGPGHGSEFMVCLPTAPDAAAAPREAPTATLSVAGPALRILLVDDNLDSSDGLSLLLRLWGHHVDVAADGPTALQAARSFGPQVVLMDIGLPGMDGHETGRRLRLEAGLEQVLLVALTGYGGEEDYRLSRESGFDFHLVKPVDVAGLQEMLARHRANVLGVVT